MDSVRIRPAREADLADLNRIYNHYVYRTHISFDTEPISMKERRAWFVGFSGSGRQRLLVAELGSRVIGYASSGPLRAKVAYDQSVETTIYLDPECGGQGIGARLYGALLDGLRSEMSVHRAYGCIAIPNEASVALHERLGFSLVGRFHEVGFKFGQYWDVVWYENNLKEP